MKKLEKKLNSEFRVIDIYYNENDVYNRNLKLGNGEILVECINELHYPFIVFKDNKYWITDKYNDLTEYTDINLIKNLFKVHKKMGWLTKSQIKEIKTYIKDLENTDLNIDLEYIEGF